MALNYDQKGEYRQATFEIFKMVSGVLGLSEEEPTEETIRSAVDYSALCAKVFMERVSEDSFYEIFE